MIRSRQIKTGQDSSLRYCSGKVDRDAATLVQAPPSEPNALAIAQATDLIESAARNVARQQGRKEHKPKILYDLSSAISQPRPKSVPSLFDKAS